MEGLSLMIDGKWATLDSGASISIENHSPVWEEEGTFSYPFELDIETNRHIIGNADHLNGRSIYDALDRKKAQLYVNNIPLVAGIIELEDQVEMEDGTVSVSLVSSKKEFEDSIKDMKCQDVPLLDELFYATIYTKAKFSITARWGKDLTIEYNAVTVDLPSEVFMDNTLASNNSIPYPAKKYCNVRICYQAGEKREYTVSDYDRPASGVCFYVLYLLDCLFAYLGIAVKSNRLLDMEDFKRLAFFTTKCSYYTKNTRETTEPYYESYSIFHGYQKSWDVRDKGDRASVDEQYISATMEDVYLDSKNFPEEEVISVIESMESAFGVRFVYDSFSNSMDIILLRDILRDADIRTFNITINSVVKIENNIRGFAVGYASSDSKDDTSYNYSDYSNVKEIAEYELLTKNISPYDKTCYVDTVTGNAYRVKIDKEAEEKGEVKKLNPALFEVGQYCDAKYGDCSDEECIMRVSSDFSPIILNNLPVTDINGKRNVYAVFIDGSGLTGYKEIRTSSKIDTEAQLPPVFAEARFITFNQRYFDFNSFDYESSAQSPLQTKDYGLAIGIMRGAGNQAKVEDYDVNYDNEGGCKFVEVSQDSIFSSDTIDNMGRVFDYNGEIPGGVDMSGRFSLKPRAEKPRPNPASDKHADMFYPITDIVAQKRGLFDKFYTEYAYFVTHRRIVRFECVVEIADLLSIDWTKRYRIGEYVGFIKSVSYSVDAKGIHDVVIEFYYI